MKIIGVSNFGLDNVSDILIASNLNSYYGKLIIDLLEINADERDTYYPKLVEDDYELYEWQP
jgi:hypothetical protein